MCLYYDQRKTLSDYQLIGKKLYCRYALLTSVLCCGSESTFAIKELSVLVIPNGCEESLVFLYIDS